MSCFVAHSHALFVVMCPNPPPPSSGTGIKHEVAQGEFSRDHHFAPLFF